MAESQLHLTRFKRFPFCGINVKIGTTRIFPENGWHDVTLTIKHYLALAQILIAGMIVWSGIHLGMTFLSHRLEDKAQRQTQVRVAPNRAPQPRALAEYKTIVTSNLFSAQQTETAGGESAGDSPDATQAPQRSSLLRLKGTIVQNRPEDSFAVLEVAQSGKQGLYRVGDQVEGMEILRVLPEWVEIREGGSVVRLAMSKSGSEGGAPAVGRPESEAGSAPEGSSMRPGPSSAGRGGEARVARMVGANSYLIDRNSLNEGLTDLSAVMSQVMVQPSIKDGQPHGFQVSSIAPGSLVTELGLRNNDVVVRINGAPIRQPEDVIGFYRQFQQLDTVRLEIERAGRPVTLTYSMR
jgi:type II secretion system protein C